MFGKKVLISTYWNVNVQMKYDFEGLVAVLISTYWNVNYNTDGKIRCERVF